MTAVAKIHEPPKPPFNSTLTTLPNYDDWNEEDLRKELAKQFGKTTEHLLHMAAIWSALERKGHDLSGIKDGFTLFLPHIAAGSVLPDLVVAFSSKPPLLRQLARLPVPEQQRMVDGEAICFVVRPGETRMLPIRTLTSNQIRQVIGDGTIRTEREQIAILTSPLPPVQPGRVVKRGRVMVNPTNGTLTIGRASAPIADVIKALKLAGVSLG